MNDATLKQLNAIVESAVEPVWASSPRKRKMREELLAHVCAVFEEEYARLGDEQAALELTTRRFGNPAELTAQLQESITPLGYVAWFLDSAWLLRGEQSTVNHNRLYTAIFLVFWFYTLSGMGLLLQLLSLPPEARPRMQVPESWLPFIAGLTGCYLVAMIATLVCRWAWPATGRRLTTILNLLLLLGPPFGTALGIYGLWKVDRQTTVGVST